MTIVDDILDCQKGYNRSADTHPKHCNCDQCWEMTIRLLWGRKLTGKLVWQRRMAKQKAQEAL